jgi:hypothetical protein
MHFENLIATLFQYPEKTYNIRIAFMNMLKSMLCCKTAHYHSVQNPWSSHLPKKMNRLEIKNYLACSSVWMRNFISHVKGRTRLELSENRQQEENTWSLKGGNNRRKAKLHNEVFHNLYSASHIIGMIKSKHARFEEHEACPAEIRNGKILVRKSERKSLFKTMDL